MTLTPRIPVPPVLAGLTCATVLAAGLLAAPAAAGDVAPAAAGPPPNSIASLGDSITRGFNACGFYLDCPPESFSTGSDTTVDSHYLRIRAVNPAIQGHSFNDGRSGATSGEMPDQADQAVAQGAQYVTILVGADDACASSEAGMTPVSTFRANIDTTLARLRAGVPGVRVMLVSIPDIRQLWQVGKDNALARTAWGLFRICQSMLANPTSTATADVQRRDRVRQRVVDYNAQLAQACAAYGDNCRFDGNVVFNYPFTLALVSGWDYFHPNTAGQAELARVSYTAGFAW